MTTIKTRPLCEVLGRRDGLEIKDVHLRDVLAVVREIGLPSIQIGDTFEVIKIGVGYDYVMLHGLNKPGGGLFPPIALCKFALVGTDGVVLQSAYDLAMKGLV